MVATSKRLNISYFRSFNSHIFPCVGFEFTMLSSKYMVLKNIVPYKACVMDVRRIYPFSSSCTRKWVIVDKNYLYNKKINSTALSRYLGRWKQAMLPFPDVDSVKLSSHRPHGLLKFQKLPAFSECVSVKTSKNTVINNSCSRSMVENLRFC